MSKHKSKIANKRAMRTIKRYSKGNYGTEGSFKPTKDANATRQMVVDENLEDQYIKDKDIT